MWRQWWGGSAASSAERLEGRDCCVGALAAGQGGVAGGFGEGRSAGERERKSGVGEEGLHARRRAGGRRRVDGRGGGERGGFGGGGGGDDGGGAIGEWRE